MIPLEGINAIRGFLARSTLRGDEVDAFNKCVGWLYQEEMITRRAMEVAAAAAAAEKAKLAAAQSPGPTPEAAGQPEPAQAQAA